MSQQKSLISSGKSSKNIPDPLAHLARDLQTEELERMRAIEGFPQGEAAAIQAMHIPPYYTACPNPFIPQILAFWQNSRPGNVSKSGQTYHREPFAADVTEGKHDPIYKVHSYHTKVPPRAIVRFVLHYTEPGDVVLDAFCGSGMTGVGAQMCGHPNPQFRAEIEAEWRAKGHPKPKWGARRAILCDLSPSATTIAANYNLPADALAFEQSAIQLLRETRKTTRHLYTPKGENKPFSYAIWSQIFACPQCGERLHFMELAYDLDTRKIADNFSCPSCSSELTKRDLDKAFTSEFDTVRNDLHRKIDYELYVVARGKRRRSRLNPASEIDKMLANQVESEPLIDGFPLLKLPLDRMYHGSRLGPKGVEHLHDLYFRRQLRTLTELWQGASAAEDPRLRSALRFLIDQSITSASKLARYPQLSPLGGVYYLPSMVAENHPIGLLESKFPKVRDHFASEILKLGQVVISTNSAAEIPGLPDDSVDYVFTDPPFGENIFYADLNLMVEAWYGVYTTVEAEAIVDRPKNKALSDYQEMMYRAFAEYRRVLKPSHWITVVFHNSSNAVWNAIQESMLQAGFVIADVRTLDKQQRSYRQVTSSAVKQDLVISAYKPVEDFEQKLQELTGTPDSAWEFVREHLKHLPVFESDDDVAGFIRERQVYALYDRMVAVHLQRGLIIPVDFAAFMSGLTARFPERDGMFFLQDQVAEYDQARAKVSKVEQLALFVNDEKSALQWLRRELDPRTGTGPQTYADLQPQFLKELRKAQHENLPELRQMLEANFLQDNDGIWYVPDPERQSDLEALRQKSLLREFETYLRVKGRLRVFRSEAIRVGFSHAWRERDYAAILNIAEKLPTSFLEDEQQLTMYVNNARLLFDKQPKQPPLL